VTAKRKARHRIVGLVISGLLAVFGAAPAEAGHDKSDIVTTDDGSTFYGEILSIKFATLNLKTDAAGTLNIEWRRVTGVTSKFEYQIELTGGIQHFGTLETSVKPGYLNIVGAERTVEVKLSDVVDVAPIEHSFWARMNGSVNFGLTYTQANEALQYNLGVNANYRSRKNLAKFSASSIFNTQDDAESTQQSYVQLLLAQVRAGKWGWFELAAIQSNPDQGYDVRTILGGGATKSLIESSSKLLLLNFGGVYNRENVTASPDVDDSFELLAGISFRRYKRNSLSPAIEVSLNSFTDITSDTRFRAIFKFIMSWKIIHDFTFNFEVNDSYDSSPPGTDANKNNVVVVTSIGYTF